MVFPPIHFFLLCLSQTKLFAAGTKLIPLQEYEVINPPSLITLINIGLKEILPLCGL